MSHRRATALCTIIEARHLVVVAGAWHWSIDSVKCTPVDIGQYVEFEYLAAKIVSLQSSAVPLLCASTARRMDWRRLSSTSWRTCSTS